MLKFLAAAGLALGLLAPAQATLLTFEDTPAGNMSTYQGFTWLTSDVENVLDYSWMPGLKDSAVSGTHVVVSNVRGNNGFSAATAFSLNSGYFTSYNGTDMQMTATAYLNGKIVDTRLITITDQRPTFVVFDQAIFGNITQVTFSNYSGIESTGNLLAFDDLTVNAGAAGDVPEPASIALLGLGLLGLVSVRRLRKA